MSGFNFTGLTPDLVIDGLFAAGFDVASGLLPLNSYENRVYQFSDDDNQKYVVKYYRPERWSDAQIQEEHQFAFELTDAEIPIIAPLTRDGVSLFSHQNYRFAVYPCRGGRIFEVDNLEQLEWMGRFVGRIHAIGQKKAFQHRTSLSTDTMLVQAKFSLQQAQLVTANLEQPFFTVLDQVIEQVQQSYNKVNNIRTHGDCHAGNILWTDKSPHFVDLDDCMMAPAIQDLWMMLSGDRQQQLLQLDTLVAGYEEFNTIDCNEFRLIESLRAMRMINYMAWLAKRWDDPAFKHSFDWFASEQYWEQQILALKQQLHALAEPALSLMP